jgi:hypothetical protein
MPTHCNYVHIGLQRCQDKIEGVHRALQPASRTEKLVPLLDVSPGFLGWRRPIRG